jgi:polysaccharide pyruvyl transferase WcaK-like protein
MSGDDAVRLGHETRPTVLGNGIGVGVRLTSYTEVEKKDVERLRPVLHSMAAKHKARLIGLPTTCSGQESDQFIIAELLKGYSNTLNSSFRFESIPDLIRKVGKCRIVITGAFHSAIFAVSQGIPVICLAKSREYSIKFDGLAHQFGKGCQVLHLNDGDFPNKLATIADWLWNEAEHLRPGLLDTAQCQMKMSADGYELIRNAYENR